MGLFLEAILLGNNLHKRLLSLSDPWQAAHPLKILTTANIDYVSNASILISVSAFQRHISEIRFYT